MSRLQEKVQAITKQTVGQMIGDDRLVDEGREQERQADETEHEANEHATGRNESRRN